MDCSGPPPLLIQRYSSLLWDLRPGQFDLRQAPCVFRGADFAGNRVTDFFEAGKIPEIGKLAALLRLDRLDRAIVAFQKNTGAVRLFPQGQSAAIPTQAGELLDEFVFADALEGGEPRDFRIRQTHLPRPATTGRATLTFEENRHAGKVIWRECSSNLKIELYEVLAYYGDVKVAAVKSQKSEAELLDQATGNLLHAVKQKLVKKQGRVDYGKLRKDGYSDRFLAKLEEA